LFPERNGILSRPNDDDDDAFEREIPFSLLGKPPESIVNGRGTFERLEPFNHPPRFSTER